MLAHGESSLWSKLGRLWATSDTSNLTGGGAKEQTTERLFQDVMDRFTGAPPSLPGSRSQPKQPRQGYEISSRTSGAGNAQQQKAR